MIANLCAEKMVRSDEAEWWFNAVYAAVRKYVSELMRPVWITRICTHRYGFTSPFLPLKGNAHSMIYVEEIPRGSVTSYSHIARLLGRRK